MKRALTVILVCLACGAFLASCGAPKFVNQNPAFSFEYPAGYEKEKLQGAGEVARIANQNQYKIPVYTASVADRAQGVKLIDIPEGVVESMKQTYPAASRFKILEKNLVKLTDGSDAVAWKLKWRWIDRVSYLQSSAVNAYKDDKLITLMGTTSFGGDTSMDEMMEQCMTLSLSP